jgi:SAM-dependent methyltransferase
MFPDDSFDVYLSFGVIEHFEEGPQKVLLEGKRVLKRGGKFLVSVPYFNFLKRLINHKNSLFKKKCCLSDGSSFYQYVYKKKELKKCLEEGGFKVIGIYAYAADSGLQNRFPIIGKMKERIMGCRYRAGYRRKAFGFLRQLYYAGTKYIPKSMFAHMIIAVCENNK